MRNKSHSKIESFFSVSILISVIVIGALSENIYSPVLKNIAQALSVNSGQIQVSYITYFVSYGVSQLFYGPISDQIGRKKTLLCSLAIYILGTSFCFFSAEFWHFLLGRSLQGFGIGSAPTVVRAIIMEAFDEKFQKKIIQRIITAATLPPLIGPLIGGIISEAFGWHMVFLFTILIAFIIEILIFLFIPETILFKTSLKGKHLYQESVAILKNREFFCYTSLGGIFLSITVLFSSQAAFMINAHQNGQIIAVSYILMANIFFYLCGSFISSRIHMINKTNMLWIGTGIIFFGAITLFLFEILNVYSIYTLIFGMGIIHFGVGVNKAHTTFSALSHIKKIFGLASALTGSMQMLITALILSICHTLPLGNLKILAIEYIILISIAFVLLYYANPRLTLRI